MEAAANLQVRSCRSESSPGQPSGGQVLLAIEDMRKYELYVGDVVSIIGGRTTVGKVGRQPNGQQPGVALLDYPTMINAQIKEGGSVTLTKISPQPALSLIVTPSDQTSRRDAELPEKLKERLKGVPVIAGDKLEVPLNEFKRLGLQVVQTVPPGPITITAATKLQVGGEGPPVPRVSYSDIGGLGPQLRRVREVVELPLKYPEIFAHLGIEAPKGILLTGPPGCGKTLMARALASEAQAYFLPINGPEIVHKYYGESEAHLRQVFQEAREHAPSIIFFDEIDAIAPRREDVSGEVEKRVVAQLMALMDGLDPRGQVVVIAATNILDSLDLALRRPGRFDREIEIPVPDQEGRKEILSIHTRQMPLAPDVDLEAIAALTQGYVGADLHALCQEAAMIALQQALPGKGNGAGAGRWQDIKVSQAAFWQALEAHKPALRRGIDSFNASQVSWEQVGGYAAVKRRLTENIVWPLQHREVFHAFELAVPQGILVYGPAGVGKSLLCRAAAAASRANIFPLHFHAFISKWVGETEKNLHNFFQRARLNSPCLILLDDLELMFPAAVNQENWSVHMLQQFLQELDNLEAGSEVILLAATRDPARVSPALLASGKLATLVEVPPPTREDRYQIFYVQLQGKPLAADVDLEVLADLTTGMVAADIAFVCRQAALLAIRELLEEEDSTSHIAARHFRQALEEAWARSKESPAHLRQRSSQYRRFKLKRKVAGEKEGVS